MKTILFPPPRSTTGRFTGLLVKATAALALLGVTVALAGVYQDGEPKPQPPPPAPEPKIEDLLPKLDLEPLKALHNVQLHQFQIAPGFGLQRFRSLPIAHEVVLGGIKYVVPKPDLIALEKAPTAYQSKSETISMADVSSRKLRGLYKTRELTKEETTGISELREGKEVVLQPTRVAARSATGGVEVDGFRALGAMRASVGCAKCHECAVGTLLGAFSYTLTPSQQALENRLRSVLARPQPAPALGVGQPSR